MLLSENLEGAQCRLSGRGTYALMRVACGQFSSQLSVAPLRSPCGRVVWEGRSEPSTQDVMSLQDTDGKRDPWHTKAFAKPPKS